MTKFSQITPSAADFATGDYLLGVNAALQDVLFTKEQVKQGIDPELSRDTTFYVATTGSDVTGDGSLGNPWATPQHAYDVVSGLELRGFVGQIQIAAGTYLGVKCEVPNTSGTIQFFGNGIVNFTSNPDCILITGAQYLDIDSIICLGTGPGVLGGIHLQGPAAQATIRKCSFANLNRCLVVELGSVVTLQNTMTFSGNATYGIFCNSGGVIFSGSNLTITGVPSYSSAFISVNDQGMFHVYSGVAPVGAATGQRFFVADGGVIQTGSNNLAYFPGDTAGLIDVGGQYDGIAATSSGVFTVATLPPVASVPAGQRSFVTDSNATLAAGLGNIVVGLSTNKVPVYSDGTNWRIG